MISSVEQRASALNRTLTGLRHVQGQTPPQTFVRPEDDAKPLPKIVLAQPAGGRSPPSRAGSGGPNSPPPQVISRIHMSFLLLQSTSIYRSSSTALCHA